MVFFYALSVGLLIQWVILPFALPSLNDGHGLLKGGDWIGFQEEAIQLAASIRSDGWGVWELRPQGNAPIGIAAAVYAVTGYTEPWVLMPLNAGLFALAATSLYVIFTLLAPRNMAFIAVMPYVLFPSAAMIYGQIHKDVWSIAGATLCILVWVRLAIYPGISARYAAIQLTLIILGAMLVWLVRPYLIQILLVASIVVFLFLVFRMAIKKESDKYSLGWWFVGIASVCMLIFVAQMDAGSDEGLELQKDEPTIEAVMNDKEVTSHISGDVESVKPAGGSEIKSDDTILTSIKVYATYIKASVGNLFSKLVDTRRGFSLGYPTAGSNIDTEKNFQSLPDMILYIPRALQIGFLAPFPHHWSEGGVSPGATYMRRLAAVEMGMTYLMLVGIVFLFAFGRFRAATIVSLIQSIVPVIILVLIVTNVGTLYRMRYLNLQMLNGLGLIGWMMWYQHFSSQRRGEQSRTHLFGQ